MSYFTFESIGIAARINCSRCGNAMDNHRRKPRTGLCGHSICEQCFFAKYTYAKKSPADLDPPGPYYRCCAPLCNEPAFSLGTPTSSSLMVAISLLEQLKWGVNSHLIKIHNKYNAFDIMQLQNDLNNAKNDIKNKDGEILKLKFDVELAKNKMLKALEANDDTIEEKQELECTIANQRDYIASLQKRLAGLPTDEPEPSPTDLSQELDTLEAKLAYQKKREYNTDTDSSLGSLDSPAKKIKASNKRRKVSLDPPQKKGEADTPQKKEYLEPPSLAPKFSYGLDSSQSTASVQSTQENEF